MKKFKRFVALMYVAFLPALLVWISTQPKSTTHYQEPQSTVFGVVTVAVLLADWWWAISVLVDRPDRE